MSSVLASESGSSFVAYHADTIEVAKGLPSDSVDLSVFSPPFSSLFTYSSSDRDLGNARNDAEFFEHYRFLAEEQFRVKIGRAHV